MEPSQRPLEASGVERVSLRAIAWNGCSDRNTLRGETAVGALIRHPARERAAHRSRRSRGARVSRPGSPGSTEGGRDVAPDRDPAEPL